MERCLEVNITYLTLVSKKMNPQPSADFRPLFIYKVLYQFISRLYWIGLLRCFITLSIHFLERSVYSWKYNFVSRNVHNYHLNKGPPRIGLKIDLHKAYESVRWNFLLHLLELHEFPTQFINWVWACIINTTFTINLNGANVSFFKGTRGLRQGSPISMWLLCKIFSTASSLS